MLESEAIKTIAIMSAIWPQNKLSTASHDVYIAGILHFDSIHMQIAIQKLQATCEWFPSLAAITKAATEANPANRIPLADEGWAEIQTAISRVGRQEGLIRGYDKGEGWSHPAIAAVVVSMGWVNLCNSMDQMADRAHFIKLYAGAAQRSYEESVMTPTAIDLIAKLTQSIGRVVEPLEIEPPDEEERSA